MKIAQISRRFMSLLLVVSFSASAGSPVWKIEKNGNRLYLGGTFHLLNAEDYPLPRGFDLAYDQAAMVVMETDVSALKEPSTAAQMVRELSYTDGRNLRQFLSTDTYRDMEQFFADRSIPMAQMLGFKPGMVATMMTILELQRLGLVGVGVDEYFDDKAKADGKPRGQLESVAAQIAFLASMGKGREDAFIAHSLADIERLPQFWPELKTAWRTGNMAKLDEIGNIPFRRDFPLIHNRLVVDRNNAWMPQITRMLQTEAVELVLVGALHLAGGEGLLHQLSARGYRVEQLQ